MVVFFIPGHPIGWTTGPCIRPEVTAWVTTPTSTPAWWRVRVASTLSSGTASSTTTTWVTIGGEGEATRNEKRKRSESGGPWTPSWFGQKLRGNDWPMKIPICTTQICQGCWVICFCLKSTFALKFWKLFLRICFIRKRGNSLEKIFKLNTTEIPFLQIISKILKHDFAKGRDLS